MLAKQIKRIKRHKRIRARVIGGPEKPRLCVFRSNQHIYVQLIDDQNGKILFAVSDAAIKEKGKVAKATEAGRAIARLALEKKIENVVFDRGGFKYHGRVKAVAEGAREAGLKF
ncbi:MAG: 50S ribosomal protein L18 [Candidatus Pacebacteria bacterium]|nr:50S ribosomal protein L18 [Candidatus Paceibacterota bacterium]